MENKWTMRKKLWLHLRRFQIRCQHWKRQVLFVEYRRNGKRYVSVIHVGFFGTVSTRTFEVVAEVDSNLNPLKKEEVFVPFEEGDKDNGMFVSPKFSSTQGRRSADK